LHDSTVADFVAEIRSAVRMMALYTKSLFVQPELSDGMFRFLQEPRLHIGFEVAPVHVQQRSLECIQKLDWRESRGS
tara:strand:- start:17887 stop:18117 length:231 start_codon:yes stop_codon:yes gene_type:complete